MRGGGLTVTPHSPSTGGYSNEHSLTIWPVHLHTYTHTHTRITLTGWPSSPVSVVIAVGPRQHSHSWLQAWSRFVGKVFVLS
jgi:hypothetical protein